MKILKDLFPVFIVVLILVFVALFVIHTPKPSQKISDVCVNRCGDNICQEIVCLSAGCTCAENPVTCSVDCS